MENIVRRIIDAFNKNIQIEKRDSIWDWCVSHQGTVEINESNLENMANTELIFGFFGGSSPVECTYDNLTDLAKAIGVMAVDNPEGGLNPHSPVNDFEINVSKLLMDIESRIGFWIVLPAFLGGKWSMETDRGIITNKHCHYLWLMKRIIELCPDRNSRIIEIGAGLGLLGYFLDKAGYKDYTVIDLAHANACQAYFLARNLPKREILLSGDQANPFSYKFRSHLKILHSSDFKNVQPDRYDLMVNIDGLTEMGEKEAISYISNDCPLLLSINHEVNHYRVIDICRPYRKLIYRYPFWLRQGYVEELYKR